MTNVTSKPGKARKTSRVSKPKAANKVSAIGETEAAEMSARPPGYDFAAFEARWRERWEADALYRVDLARAKRPYYNLMMFPYPSAEGLHVGNMYAYVGSDIHGRWMAMRGYDVFEPMGFDAFGIHSENFAIKQGVHPRAVTERNVRRFREEQLKRIGNRFDWSHEVNSTDPAYYRWTQWIFVQLFKAGLAERVTGVVNWCPNDKTVLADEQVIDGRCERCGAIVEKRELPTWSLKITRYADALLDNLATLDWSERVKAAQRNWIGRSRGLEFSLAVAGMDGMAGSVGGDERVAVFTTRPDTIYGVTFVALAPDHPLVERITDAAHLAGVRAYQAEAAQQAAMRQSQASQADDDDRASDEANGAEAARPMPTTGAFTGAYAIHPLSGEQVPIWIADYVLLGYGTGAIMAVPAHDERDLTFARAMGLPVRAVVRPTGAAAAETTVGATVGATAATTQAFTEAFTGDGELVNSGEWSGMPSAQARDAIGAAFEARGIGRRTATYHLRDWLISRQRYWGAPIPIIYCPEHDAVAAPEEELPVLLPEVEEYLPTGTGDSPLARIESFVNTTCPICGRPARRETDVCDNFLDSAWYFLRYPSSDDTTQAWNPTMTRKWLPVDMYIGGAEHSVLHLLYARFISMALHDLGWLDFAEPFTRFRAHGIITKNGQKISKSKGNVINPDGYISRYGADVFRLYLMFMGPYQVGGDFSDKGIGGVVRFLERVWAIVTQRASTASAEKPTGEAQRKRHETIQRVSDDTAALKYNTAIAALMEYLNALEAQSANVTRAELRTLLTLLAPYAPYISEELWIRAGFGGASDGSVTGSIHRQPWPVVDVAALRRATVTLVVQVDGRVRDRIEIASGADEAAARAAALASERVRRALGVAGDAASAETEQATRQVVYVPDRLINLVTR